MNLLHRVLPVQPLENVMNITKITEIKVGELTMEKIKSILGSEFFEKYKSEELDFQD